MSSLARKLAAWASGADDADESEVPLMRYSQWASKVASNSRTITSSIIPPVIRAAHESGMGPGMAAFRFSGGSSAARPPQHASHVGGDAGSRSSAPSFAPPSYSPSPSSANINSSGPVQHGRAGSRGGAGPGAAVPGSKPPVGPGGRRLNPGSGARSEPTGIVPTASQLAVQRSVVTTATTQLRDLATLLEVDAYEDVDYCGSARNSAVGSSSSSGNRGGSGSSDSASGSRKGSPPTPAPSGLGGLFSKGPTGTLSLQTQESAVGKVRLALLDLWRSLLGAIQQRMVETRQADATHFYRCILRIMQRKEFDPTMLRLDVHGKPTCDFNDIGTARRYRALTFLTQMFANKSIAACAGDADLLSRHSSLISFCGKIFAVNFFRISSLARDITESLSLSNEEQASFSSELLGKYSCVLPARRMDELALSSGTMFLTAATPVAQQQRRSTLHGKGVMLSSFPALFGWERFHTALVAHGKELRPDGGAPLPTIGRTFETQARAFPLVAEERDCGVPGTEGWDPYLKAGNQLWMSEFRKRGTLFYVFLRQWLEVVLCALPGGLAAAEFASEAVDWEAIPGYNAFLFAFVHDFVRSTPRFDRSLLDCSIALLRTDYALVAVYSSVLLRHTSVFDFAQVTETLFVLGNWFDSTCFAEKDPIGAPTNTLPARIQRTLPVGFDTALFCRAMRTIIESDQQQLIARALSFVYRWADAFGTVAQREEVFLHFLLADDIFYKLFLHWDPSTRNSFVQLIVYRSLAHGRSELSRRGFIETTELGLRDVLASTPARAGKSPSEVAPDSELKVDVEICQRMDALQKAVQTQLRSSNKRTPPRYSERELLMIKAGRIRGPALEQVDRLLEEVRRAEAADAEASAHRADDNTAQSSIFASRLESYAPHALVEYVSYLSRYYQWEHLPNPKTPPPLVPLHLLETHEVDSFS